MKIILSPLLRTASSVAWCLVAFTAAAADYPAPKEGDWVARDFRFHTGEVMPELRLHYTTVGEPSGQPVLILHGTDRVGRRHADARISPASCSARASRWMRANISSSCRTPSAHGKSSKPSDGLRAKFPRYNYDDMVAAQYRLVTEGLGIRHLRLVLGNSMGGMHTWIWGVTYPDFMDALVPMASQPTEMSSRNWMMRRLIIDAIRNDPEWNGGNYTSQPRALKSRQRVLRHRHQRRHAGLPETAPTREEADKLLDERLAAPFTADANDFLYQWESSRDYNPVAGAGAHPGRAAGDQLCGRRAQSAGDRRDGARTQAREERPPLPDPGQRGHARPRHNRYGKVLQAADRGTAGHCPARSDVVDRLSGYLLLGQACTSR